MLKKALVLVVLSGLAVPAWADLGQQGGTRDNQRPICENCPTDASITNVQRKIASDDAPVVEGDKTPAAGAETKVEKPAN